MSKNTTYSTMFVLVILMIGFGEYLATLEVSEDPKEFIIETPTHYYDSISWEEKPIEK